MKRFIALTMFFALGASIIHAETLMQRKIENKELLEFCIPFHADKLLLTKKWQKRFPTYENGYVIFTFTDISDQNRFLNEVKYTFRNPSLFSISKMFMSIEANSEKELQFLDYQMKLFLAFIPPSIPQEEIILLKELPDRYSRLPKIESSNALSSNFLLTALLAKNCQKHFQDSRYPQIGGLGFDATWTPLAWIDRDGEGVDNPRNSLKEAANGNEGYLGLLAEIHKNYFDKYGIRYLLVKHNLIPYLQLDTKNFSLLLNRVEGKYQFCGKGTYFMDKGNAIYDEIYGQNLFFFRIDATIAPTFVKSIDTSKWKPAMETDPLPCRAQLLLKKKERPRGEYIFYLIVFIFLACFAALQLLFLRACSFRVLPTISTVIMSMSVLAFIALLIRIIPIPSTLADIARFVSFFYFPALIFDALYTIEERRIKGQAATAGLVFLTSAWGWLMALSNAAGIALPFFAYFLTFGFPIIGITWVIILAFVSSAKKKKDAEKNSAK